MCNMHAVDRLLRAVLGLFLIWVGAIDGTFIASFWLSVIVVLFGVMNIISVVTAFCPLYYLAGISTASKAGCE